MALAPQNKVSSLCVDCQAFVLIVKPSFSCHHCHAMSKQTLKKAQFMFIIVTYVYNTRPISSSFQDFGTGLLSSTKASIKSFVTDDSF